jgi:hypothetical protein
VTANVKRLPRFRRQQSGSGMKHCRVQLQTVKARCDAASQ